MRRLGDTPYAEWLQGVWRSHARGLGFSDGLIFQMARNACVAFGRHTLRGMVAGCVAQPSTRPMFSNGLSFSKIGERVRRLWAAHPTRNGL
ncbi:hypothetical protein [Kingella potus]|uniref:hypothetical protein n=1 Tax=Kingella potus TaxID=265175 RepID=UPI001FD63222|nr:hypothetical protein [Kingella potus]UOP01700.1 hypothetical protein LVJ84_06125 [Kingella potus]